MKEYFKNTVHYIYPLFVCVCVCELLVSSLLVSALILLLYIQLSGSRLLYVFLLVVIALHHCSFA